VKSSSNKNDLSKRRRKEKDPRPLAPTEEAVAAKTNTSHMMASPSTDHGPKQPSPKHRKAKAMWRNTKKANATIKTTAEATIKTKTKIKMSTPGSTSSITVSPKSTTKSSSQLKQRFLKCQLQQPGLSSHQRMTSTVK